MIEPLAVERGIHVVASNKKPLTEPMPSLRALRDAARHAHRSFLYETTVGASLPVIQTLKDIIRTGDRVRCIDGSFSGTLGFLTNELMAGADLGDAVRRAKELGYTEPNPADDLTGLDVARKALILALLVPLASVGLALMPEKVFQRADTIAEYTEDLSAMQRIQGWGVAVNVALKHPLGSGFELDATPVDVWMTTWYGTSIVFMQLTWITGLLKNSRRAPSRIRQSRAKSHLRASRQGPHFPRNTPHLGPVQRSKGLRSGAAGGTGTWRKYTTILT